MSVDHRRSSPSISRFAKTLLVAGALVALAVPAWRAKSLTATFRASAFGGTGFRSMETNWPILQKVDAWSIGPLHVRPGGVGCCGPA